MVQGLVARMHTRKILQQSLVTRSNIGQDSIQRASRVAL